MTCGCYRFLADDPSPAPSASAVPPSLPVSGPPPIPSRPPVSTSHSLDSSSLPSTSSTFGGAQPNSLGPSSSRSKPAVSVQISNPIRPPVSASDNHQSPSLSKKKSALFQGLQKVGDRVKKGLLLRGNCYLTRSIFVYTISSYLSSPSYL